MWWKSQWRNCSEPPTFAVRYTYDNARAESFMKTLKVEAVYLATAPAR
jgi:hypothetical protein